ncbi:hypothetical protein BH10PAT3_BH10PAT3_6950 [soil metagenome]
MPSAELIDDKQKDRPDHAGHAIRIAHVKTRHGVATVRSDVPDGSKDDYIFVGGLLSGGSYERAVCVVATAGHIGRTIRHGSNSVHGAIDADADEVVGVIETLGLGHTIHIIAHSKGGPVAVRAAARLSRETDIVDVTLVNPALGRSRLPHGLKDAAGVVLEHAAVYLTYPGRMAQAARGAVHELMHRPTGIMGEVSALFSDQDFTRDMDILHERKIPLTLVEGSFDHVVPHENTAAAAIRYRFDHQVNPHGPVNGSHYGIVAVSGFMEEIGGLRAS